LLKYIYLLLFVLFLLFFNICVKINCLIISSIAFHFSLFPVQSLRSKTDDIGKNIRREHLLVVANSLSVSGKFHGLSSQGLKQQRTRLSVSSPFSEACFAVSNMCYSE
jgi:hypothetical protein